MTTTYSARLSVMPAVTAPARPPVRSPAGRWSRRTGMWPAAATASDPLRGVVVAVVDEEDLGPLRVVEGGGQPAHEHLDVAALVVGRDDDRGVGAHCWSSRISVTVPGVVPNSSATSSTGRREASSAIAATCPLLRPG